ncbi:MAG: UbiA-like polyprenyltransferase [Flavitalea sp.]
MATVKNYLSLVTFSHTIFAMPFAMIGFTLGIINHASVFGVSQWNLNKTIGWDWDITNLRWPYVGNFLLVILCMVFARSAAMAFNRYLDKNFDALNARTAIREIPAGIISANKALLFTVINALLFIACTWLINPICFYLSPVALLVVLGYSFTKRFTPLCHLILGLGLSLAPIGAYLAVTGYFSVLPVLFSLAVIFWVSGFDIIYALQDVDFDRQHRLYSIPAWLGKKNALRVSSFLHLLSAVSVLVAGIYGGFNILYWAGALVFAGMLIYQHSIVNPTDISRVNRAFMTANGFASVVFAVFVISDRLIF